MIRKCQSCLKDYDSRVIVDGKTIYNAKSRRKFCYNCLPYRAKDRRNPTERAKDKDGCRNCYCCKQRKPLDLFTKVGNDTKSGRSWLCKVCNSEKTKIRQKQSKVKWIEYKGGKCQICGYSKCNRSLHFHHINPNEKDFTLGRYRVRAWEIVKKELDKCILVCANCHGEIHEGLISLDN